MKTKARRAARGSTPPPITLGDRKFAIVTSTSLRRDHRIAELAIASGIAGTRQDPGESEAQFAARLERGLRVADIAHDVIATQIAPFGQRWDPANAAETARYLGMLDCRPHARVVNALLVQAVREMLTGVFSGDARGDRR